ncbi:MAG: hypothetical protein GF313_11185 [Caldithrix sp.]|nr:hypothetical protein [Caldithrix sp.]
MSENTAINTADVNKEKDASASFFFGVHEDRIPVDPHRLSRCLIVPIKILNSGKSSRNQIVMKEAAQFNHPG